MYLLNRGKYSWAIEYFDEAIRLDSEYDIAHYHKEIALKAMFESDQAIKCFDKAIRLYPKYGAAYYHKDMVLSAMDKHNQAIECPRMSTCLIGVGIL